MSYEKYDWRTGELITEVRLDHMEDGIYEANTGLETKAEVDGAYESMTVGNAEQLVSTQYTEDQEPYIFRTSGGSADIGNREEDTIVGGTVAWNQLFVLQAKSGDSGVEIEKVGDTSIRIYGTATGSVLLQMQLTGRPIVGHKYYLDKGSDSTLFAITNDNKGITAGFDKRQTIGNPTTDQYLYVNVASGTELDVTAKPMFIDLTQMFGSAVADAVYAMEQANAGSGVAWFKAMYPLDYYAYNTGELKSVEGLESHDMVGFNQLDASTVEEGKAFTENGTITTSSSLAISDYIHVLPNTSYYFKREGINGVYGIAYYDENKEFISAALPTTANTVITTPSNCHYVRLNLGRTTYTEACFNLHWSGTRDGEYEPYEKRSYALDSTLTLRGIPKVDADGQMYYDGDTYEADGTVTRKYGIVDLGTLNWSYNSDRAIFYSNGLVNIIKRTSYTALGNLVCPKYLTVIASGNNGGIDKTISVGTLITTDGINIKDSAYTDAQAFKTAMSGVMLVYELATPTTETAEPFTTPQVVEDWGTEEYVTTGIVAVGHETKYPQNLRDKLQHLPVLAEDDGAYLIQQTGTQMHLVNFRIPKAEDLADGTYVLKATVSGGTPTYSWEAE